MREPAVATRLWAFLLSTSLLVPDPALALRQTGVEEQEIRGQPVSAKQELIETLAPQFRAGAEEADSFIKRYPKINEAFGRHFIESQLADLLWLAETARKTPLTVSEPLVALRDSFGVEWVNDRWAYLIAEIKSGVAQKKYAQLELLSKGLSNLKNSFGIEWIDDRWTDLAALINSEQMSPIYLSRTLSSLKDSFGIKWVNDRWADLAALGKATKTPADFFESLVTLQDSFGIEWVDSQWTNLSTVAKTNEASVALFMLIAHLEKTLGSKWIKAHWLDLAELEMHSGYTYASDLDENAFDALVDSLGIRWVKSHWADLITLGKAVGGNVGDAYKYWLPNLKGFGSKWLSNHWAGIMAIGIAAGDDAAPIFRWTSDSDGTTEKEGSLSNLFMYFGPTWLDGHWTDLVTLAKTAGASTDPLFRFFVTLGNFFGFEWVKNNWERLVENLTRLLVKTTDYNRPRILALLSSQAHLRRLKAANADLLDHLVFYTQILSQEKRIAYQALEGISEGIEKGIVDAALPEQEKDRILVFISKLHNFSPTLYAVYKQGGDQALQTFIEFSEKALRDKVGPEELRQFQQTYTQKGLSGSEVLAATIQIAIPASGASFVNREEIRGLMEKFIAAGDLRNHVPEVLRDRDFGDGDADAITLTAWRLKQRETFDPDKKIARLLNALKHPEGLKPAQRTTVMQEAKTRLKGLLTTYLANREPAGRAAVLEAFYAYARHNDQLGEKIDRIQPDDYQGLNLLEQLFIDKDNLAFLFREVLEEPGNALPQTSIEKGPIANPKNLAKQINGLWRNMRPDKEARIKAMLQAVLPDAAESQLIPLITEKGLQELVRTAVREPSTRPVTPHELIEEFFQDPMGLIQNKMEKFEPQELDRKLSLEFRVVKGIPYGLWGINCGVCIATDLDLWKDPRFFLLAMIDRSTEKVVGFVHLFVPEPGALTVPGIEPSVELLSEVKPGQIYPLIEKALIRVATEGGYKTLDLPTNSTILSNRTDIAREAQRRYASRVVQLPDPIQWNHLPQPYPFQEVYRIWSKEPTALTAAGIEEENQDKLANKAEETSLIEQTVAVYAHPSVAGGALSLIPEKWRLGQVIGLGEDPDEANAGLEVAGRQAAQGRLVLVAVDANFRGRLRLPPKAVVLILNPATLNQVDSRIVAGYLEQLRQQAGRLIIDLSSGFIRFQELPEPASEETLREAA